MVCYDLWPQHSWFLCCQLIHLHCGLLLPQKTSLAQFWSCRCLFLNGTLAFSEMLQLLKGPKQFALCSSKPLSPWNALLFIPNPVSPEQLFVLSPNQGFQENSPSWINLMLNFCSWIRTGPSCKAFSSVSPRTRSPAVLSWWVIVPLFGFASSLKKKKDKKKMLLLFWN